MMKKIIFALVILILIPITVLAWDDCPSGEVLCEGKCGLFVDTDNDGICDRSQLSPEDRNDHVANTQWTEEEIEELHGLITGKDIKTKTVNEIAELYQINSQEYADKVSEYLGVSVNLQDSFQYLHDNHGLEPKVPKDIATAMRVGTQINILEPTEPINKQSERIYHLLPISLLLIILYAITHILSKKKTISIVNHRKIWNLLLLITFLISGISGILLIIKINFGLASPLPFNVLFWHVETGIAMFVISIFHILWHWAYFKSILRIKK